MNSYRVESEGAWLQVTNNDHEFFVINNDLERCLQRGHWYAKRLRSGNWHAVTNVWVDGRWRRLYLSRFIMGLEWGDKRQVHHVNGNTHINGRDNLQILSPSHHHFTMLWPTNRPATLISVTKWGTYRRCRIRAEDGTKIPSKNFKTLEEAIQNRDLVLRIHRPNFLLPEGAR